MTTEYDDDTMAEAAAEAGENAPPPGAGRADTPTQDRCPQCGRFQEYEPTGYFMWVSGVLRAFCDEQCAAKFPNPDESND